MKRMLAVVAFVFAALGVSAANADDSRVAGVDTPFTDEVISQAEKSGMRLTRTYDGSVAPAKMISGKTVYLFVSANRGFKVAKKDDEDEEAARIRQAKEKQQLGADRLFAYRLGILLSDALKRSGAENVVLGGEWPESQTKPAGAIEIRAKVEPSTDFPILDAKYETGRNIGMAMIPIAGLFTSRFWAVKVNFQDTFQVEGVTEPLVFTMAGEGDIAVNRMKSLTFSFFSEAGQKLYEFYENKQLEAIKEFLGKLAAIEPAHNVAQVEAPVADAAPTKTAVQ